MQSQQNPPMTRSLHGLLHEHHAATHPDRVILDRNLEHLHIDTNDQPAEHEHGDDGHFIPHAEQDWDPEPQAQDHHSEQPDLWIQTGNNHYNLWQGQWWQVARFDWVTPRRGRSCWNPATWTRVSFDSISVRIE